MYGLNVKLQNNYGKYISELLANVDIERFIWQIEADDVIVKENQNNLHGLFDVKNISGKTFYNAITLNEYYLIFTDYKAFFHKDDIVEIKNGMDFYNSKCELVFLCTDSVYAEIYCKSKDIFSTILKNCKNADIVTYDIVDFDEIIKRSMIAF